MPDELERVAVYKNLHYRWSFYGLQMFHLGIAGGIGTLVLFVSFVVGFNMLFAIAVFVASCAGLAVLQWRKPPNYIPDLFEALITPRHLSCTEDDDITWPFPVSREELRK